MHKVVAIDGPAGSGKGTVSKIIAERLNLIYIDTGAMYRAVAYACLKNNIDIKDEQAIISMAECSKIDFFDDKVYLNDEDVSSKIRTMEVTKIVSSVSSIVKLREILVRLQQDMANSKNVIMEGRDITTVVLPNANYKFYLDASVESRAQRRFKENIQKGMDVNYDEILDNIKTRDYNDMHKKVGALMRTSDAVYIDTTNLTIDEVVNKIIEIIEVKQ